MGFYDYYTIETDATEYPVKLDEVKDFIKVRNTKDNAIIQAYIATATEWGEKYTGRDFIQKTYNGFFSALKQSRFESYPFIELAKSPYVSLSSMETVVDGVNTDVSASYYVVKQKSGMTRILFTSSLTADTDVAYPIQCQFVAGYGATADDVPEVIKTALKMHIAFMYENRGDTHAEGKIRIPAEVKVLYSKYKMIRDF